MSDEDVRTHADEFPEDKHHHEVICQHDAEHGEKEERETGKKAGIPFLVAHVAERVGENQNGNRGHHQKHHLAEVVKGHADGEIQLRTKGQPVQREHLAVNRLIKQPPTQNAPCDGCDEREGSAECF